MILTNCEKDAASALESYRRRNDVGILFDDFKNTLDGDRTRSHSPQTMLGRLIVIFLSTILVSQLRRTVEAIPGKDRRWWNWKEFLRHAASYSKCHFAGKYNDVYTSPTKGQRMIFNLLRIPYMWKGKKVSWPLQPPLTRPSYNLWGIWDLTPVSSAEKYALQSNCRLAAS